MSMRFHFLAFVLMLLCSAAQLSAAQCTTYTPVATAFPYLLTVAQQGAVNYTGSQGSGTNPINSTYQIQIPDPYNWASFIGLDSGSVFESCNGVFASATASLYTPNVAPTPSDIPYNYTYTATASGGGLTVTYTGVSILPPAQPAMPQTYTSFSANNSLTLTYNIASGAFSINYGANVQWTSYNATNNYSGAYSESGSASGVFPLIASYRDTVCQYLAQAKQSSGQTSDLRIASVALASVITARQQPGQSTNLALRDAEYALRNWIGGQIAIGQFCVSSTNVDCLDPLEYTYAYFYDNPTATGAYNGWKWLTNAAGRGSWNRADAQNPNSEPGGWDAAVDAYLKSLQGNPPGSICDASPTSTTASIPTTPLQPVPLPPNSRSDVSVFVASDDNGSTFYIDPPMNAGFKYDAGVGPLIGEIFLPQAGQNLFTLQFEQKTFSLMPGEAFDFRKIDPLGASTFNLYAGKPSVHPANAFVLGIQPMEPGTMAISQEPLPIKDVSVNAQGTYAPAAQGGNATFTASVTGPMIPGGSFQYSYAGWALASTTISHVSFIGPSTVVVCGNANVNGDGNFTFTTTLAGNDIPRSIGIEILNADGTLYFSAAPQQLLSGNFHISDIAAVH